MRATFGAVLFLSFGLTTEKLCFLIRINVAREGVGERFDRFSEFTWINITRCCNFRINVARLMRTNSELCELMPFTNDICDKKDNIVS